MPENKYYTGNKVWGVLMVKGNEIKLVCPCSNRLTADQAKYALTKHHPDKGCHFEVVDPW